MTPRTTPNKTLEVSLSEDTRKFILKHNHKKKTVDVIFMYKNPLLEMPYNTVKDFERLFLGMFPECDKINFSDPAALNMVTGLANLNSQKNNFFPDLWSGLTD